MNARTSWLALHGKPLEKTGLRATTGYSRDLPSYIARATFPITDICKTRTPGAHPGKGVLL